MNKKHILKGKADTKTVYLDHIKLDPEISKCYHKHADEFDWGNAGSGAAQLALAVFLKLKGDICKYQRFKFEVIAGLPNGRDFIITFNYASPWTRETAIINARAYNKNISIELFRCKTNKEILAYVQPNLSEYYAESLGIMIIPSKYENARNEKV